MEAAPVPIAAPSPTVHRHDPDPPTPLNTQATGRPKHGHHAPRWRVRTASAYAGNDAALPHAIEAPPAPQRVRTPPTTRRRRAFADTNPELNTQLACAHTPHLGANETETAKKTNSILRLQSEERLSADRRYLPLRCFPTNCHREK